MLRLCRNHTFMKVWTQVALVPVTSVDCHEHLPTADEGVPWREDEPCNIPVVAILSIFLSFTYMNKQIHIVLMNNVTRMIYPLKYKSRNCMQLSVYSIISKSHKVFSWWPKQDNLLQSYCLNNAQVLNKPRTERFCGTASRSLVLEWPFACVGISLPHLRLHF